MHASKNEIQAPPNFYVCRKELQGPQAVSGRFSPLPAPFPLRDLAHRSRSIVFCHHRSTLRSAAPYFLPSPLSFPLSFPLRSDALPRTTIRELFHCRHLPCLLLARWTCRHKQNAVVKGLISINLVNGQSAANDWPHKHLIVDARHSLCKLAAHRACSVQQGPQYVRRHTGVPSY